MIQRRLPLLLAGILGLAARIGAEEPAVIYQIGEYEYEISEAVTTFSIQINRTQRLDQTTTINLRLAPFERLTPDSPYFPAEPGLDFVDAVTVVTFAPGETSHRVSVQLLNDRVEDGTKWFKVSLTGDGAPLYPIGPFRVLDNELGYSLTDPAGASVGSFYEGSDPHLILHRLGDYDQASAASVEFFGTSNEPGMAQSGVDFTPGTVTVNFAAGQKEARVNLPIINDAIAERNERMPVRFTSSVTRERPLASGWITIRDNEFNPLPTADFCPAVAVDKINSMVPAAGGKVMLLWGADFQTTASTLTRVNLSGEIDPTFTPVELSPFAFKLGVAGSGKFYLQEGTGNNQERLRRLNEDGSVDASFTPFVEHRIEDFKQAADGKVILVVTDAEGKSRLVRLNSNGTPDESFQPPTIEDDDTTIIPAEDGRLYIDGFWKLNGLAVPSTTIRLNVDGSIDSSFVIPTGEYGMMAVGGALYTSDASSRIFRRYRSDGSLDASFQAVPLGSWGTLWSDENWLYVISEDDNSFVVERFSHAGVRDSSFTRGTIDSIGWIRMIVGGHLLIMQSSWPNGFTKVNGRPVTCPTFVRVALQEAPAQIMVEPGHSDFLENVPSRVLSVIRTGVNNLSGGSIRYRVRNDSAIAGSDFSMATEGEIVFAAGESQKPLTFEVINDRELELPKLFHVDFLNADGAVLSSSPVTIISEDIGLKIIRRIEGNLWELLPVNNFNRYVTLYRTENFKTRSYISTPASNQPFQLRFDAQSQFFYTE